MDRKVLVVPTGGLRREGITSSILSFMRSMDRDGLDVRVAAVYNNESDVLGRVEIARMRCRGDSPTDAPTLFGYVRFLISYMRRERIDVVHVHGSSSVMAIELRWCAARGSARADCALAQHQER